MKKFYFNTFGPKARIQDRTSAIFIIIFITAFNIAVLFVMYTFLNQL